MINISGTIRYGAHEITLASLKTCGKSDEFSLSYDANKLASTKIGATFLEFLSETDAQVCESSGETASHQIISLEVLGRLRRTADLTKEKVTDVIVDADRVGLPPFTFVVEKIIRFETKERIFSCAENLVLPLATVDSQLLQSAVLPPNN